MPSKSTLIRRVLLMILASFLPFFLTLVGNSIVQVHTKDGRLAMYAIRHSQEMTDDQLTRAIGDDPLAVIRRAGLMTRAIAPIAALISGILVALFERRIPGKMTAFVLAPYFLWDFSMSAFSAIRTPFQTVLEVAKVLGANAVYIALAAFTAVAIARLLTYGRFSSPNANPA